MAKRTKLNHEGLILESQKLSERSLLPGMILQFSYNAKTAYDRKPLIYFMDWDKEKVNIEGINLNYLKPSNLQKFFTNISNRIVPIYYENLLKLKKPYQRVQVASRLSMETFNNQTVYKMIFPTDNQLIKAYRSYKLTTVSSMKVVNLRLDMLNDSTPYNRGDIITEAYYKKLRGEE